MTSDPVNNPSHYGGVNNMYEHVKVMEATLTKEQFVGAMIYQASKYLYRLEKKEDVEPHLDAAKAAWFANRLTHYLTPKPIQQAVATSQAETPFDTDMKPEIRVFADGSITSTDPKPSPLGGWPHGPADPRKVPRPSGKGD